MGGESVIECISVSQWLIECISVVLGG